MFAIKMNPKPRSSIRLYCILICYAWYSRSCFAAVIVTPVALALRKVLRGILPKKSKTDAVTNDATTVGADASRKLQKLIKSNL